MFWSWKQLIYLLVLSNKQNHEFHFKALEKIYEEDKGIAYLKYKEGRFGSYHGATV